jgi:hypothetical protein
MDKFLIAMEFIPPDRKAPANYLRESFRMCLRESATHLDSRRERSSILIYFPKLDWNAPNSKRALINLIRAVICCLLKRE